MAYLLSIFFIFQELLQSIPSHLEKCNKYLETFTKWRGIERLVCHGNKLGTSRMLVSIHPSMHITIHSTSICLVGSLQPLCYMQGMMKAQQEGQKVKVAQSCPTLRPHGLYSPWDSPVQNTRVGSLSLLQGIFPRSRGSSRSLEPRDLTQVSTLQVDSLLAEPQGKPKNTGVGSLSLLLRIFLAQELNLGLLHCSQSHHLSHFTI